ncbi:MAG: TatD family hydrolase [Deltaproteobacteria bacterium]|nr:TatD family hydrolase [Deltaproteobacteria bacterium]
MIDCHTHLTDDSFAGDLPEVLQRARAVGVEQMALVGQDLEENQKVLGMSARHEGLLLPFLGLHPDRFADRGEVVPAAEVQAVRELIRREAAHITGIGEVGLDYWVCQDEQRREQQRGAFGELVRLAQELDLPLNVHSRSAGRHTIDMLLEMGARRVLMHAFDGKASYALKGAQAGFLFSIPPSIVRSPQKQKLVRALPLESLALETDSPVLGPEQGLRNEPANLALCVAEIARIKGLDEALVRSATLANTRRLFFLDVVSSSG